DRGRDGRQGAAAQEQLFVFSGSGFRHHGMPTACAGIRPLMAEPVSLRSKVRTTASATPYKSGRNAVWKCSSAIVSAPPLADASSRPNTGPSSALNVKFTKLTTPVAVPLTSGGLTSLITV